jgi:translation initiation factor 1 (eIF-1/SUI1)
MAQGGGKEGKANEKRDVPGATLKHNPFAVLKKDGAPSSSLVNEPARAAAGDAPSAERKGGSVVVRREKKGRGGKAVTVIEGAGLAGRDLEELARACAKSLGAGARVEDGTVVVQGEQEERVVALLVSRGIERVIRGTGG